MVAVGGSSRCIVAATVMERCRLIKTVVAVAYATPRVREQEHSAFPMNRIPVTLTNLYSVPVRFMQ